MKKIICLLPLSFLVKLSFAQEPVITLSKTVGGTGAESIRDLIADRDGHLIALGQCDSIDRDSSLHYHGGSSDIWLVKMDAGGNILWQKCFGGSKEDYAYQIIQTADSGFLFAGWSYSHDGDINVSIYDFFTWIVKIDTNGNIQWQQGLVGSQPYDIIQLKSGKYLIACYTANTTIDFPDHYGGAFSQDAWIWILSNSGAKDTAFHYGGSSDDYISNVIELDNGELQLFGYTSSIDYDLTNTTDFGGRDGWILKIDSTGGIVWQKRWGGNFSDEINGAVDLKAGFLIAGTSSSTDGILGESKGPPDIWIMKVDLNGELQSTFLYGAAGNQTMHDRLRIIKVNGGKYAIAAITDYGGGDVGSVYGLNDFWFFTVDSNGTLQDSKVAGGSSYDTPFSNISSGGNEAILSGITSSNDFDVQGYHANGDGWIIKIEGFTGIAEVSAYQKNIVSIFPNPAHDIASVYMDMATVQQSQTLDLYNLQGQFVCSYKIGKSSNQFSVTEISRGLYLFQLKGKTGQTLASGNFMVQ